MSPTATLIRNSPSDTEPGAGGLILINSRFNRKSQEIFAIAAWSQAANVFRLREIAVQLLKQQRAVLRTWFSRVSQTGKLVWSHLAGVNYRRQPHELDITWSYLIE